MILDGDIVFVDYKTECELDDLILFEVGESIRSLACLFDPIKIKIGSIEIDMPDADHNVSFEDRLSEILEFSRYISDNSCESVFLTTEKLLKLDGWHIGQFSFRSPPWMFDHRELTISEASKIKGLEWLGDTTSNPMETSVI